MRQNLTTGLAWNEAVKSLIDYLMPLDRDSILLKFVYAFSITLIVVLVSTYLARLTTKDATKEE